MRISDGLVIRHESLQGQTGSRSDISALPVIGKNLTFIACYSKILNNFQTWPPVNAKNPTTARAGDCLWQCQAEGVGRHLARGAGRAAARICLTVYKFQQNNIVFLKKLARKYNATY